MASLFKGYVFIKIIYDPRNNLKPLINKEIRQILTCPIKNILKKVNLFCNLNPQNMVKAYN